MTVTISPPMFLQFFNPNNSGAPAAGYKLFTYIAGTTTKQATWTDSTQTVQNANPIILDSSGVGYVWGDPTLAFKFVWAPANDTDPPTSPIRTVDNLYFPLDIGVLTQQLIGSILYPRTLPEIAAGVTPVNYAYPPYDVRRYGAVGDGVTNDSPAFNLAGTIGVPIFVPDPPVAWLLNSNVTGTFKALGYPQISGIGTITLVDLTTNDADAFETVVTALEAGTATNIATFGDSTMWGANVANLNVQVAIPPYAQLANFINAYFGNSACTAVNFAISGTTLNQMLLGTDGSGLTYAARLASTNAPVVYMNHGVNDAFGPNSTTPALYRQNLIACIRQTRLAGKSLVFVTPHACLTMGTLGTPARAENTARFAAIMRDVATMHGVRLVDNFKYLTQWMGIDNAIAQTNVNLPLTVLPDGVHGPQGTYTFTGNNLADAILGAEVETFTSPGQRISCTRANVQATNITETPSTSSRFSGAVATSTAATQSMRVLLRIGNPGLDISMAYAVDSLNSNAITVNYDGAVAVGTLSQFNTGFTTSNFLQDVEATVVRNAVPGFHILLLNASTGAITLNGLRARAVEKPLQLGSSTTDMAQRELVSPRLYIASGSPSNIVVMTDYVCGRLTENCELEWTGQMTVNSGLCLASYVGSISGSPTPQQTIMFILNASGFATIAEATAPGTFASYVLDSTSHLGASHIYRVIVSPTTVQMFVDDVSVGTATLAQTQYGGWLGVWKNTNTDVLSFTNVSRVWHF